MNARMNAVGNPAGNQNAPYLPPRTTIDHLRDFHHFGIAPLIGRDSPALYQQCVDVQAEIRAFADRHVRPHLAAWDMQSKQDHDFVPWPAIEAGLDVRLFSMGIPALFGGRNMSPVSVAVACEEIAAADAGLMVVYGAHALAWMLIVTSMDLRMLQRLGREISDGEKNGKPVILALAHTEVTGGSDVEDVEDIRKARLTSRWEKVPGGYRVRAHKVFSSNGGIADYIVLTAYGDYADPMNTMRSFIIRPGTPGMVIGRPERKLGQRMCIANEITCQDVFVPDENTIASGNPGRMLDSTLTLTRAPVGAMAAGITRGALERTLDYLAQKRTANGWLFDEQWVQMALADMIFALQAARGLYIDASLLSEEYGFAQFMRQMPAHVPDVIGRSMPVRRVTDARFLGGLMQKQYERKVSDAQVQRITANASLAKFGGTDLAVNACMKAMEILGEDANDPRWGVEKCLRDAKLGQIFEGTNQICRLHTNRGLLA